MTSTPGRASSRFNEDKDLAGGLVSHAKKKTWSRSFLLKDFRAHNMAEPVTGPARHQRYQINFICS